jgi:curli biogenesis system outer membrane secretion channel CsgG
MFLNTVSINKLKESGKFTVEEKTFTDKILEEFDKNKPGFCKD